MTSDCRDELLRDPELVEAAELDHIYQVAQERMWCLGRGMGWFSIPTGVEWVRREIAKKEDNDDNA